MGVFGVTVAYVECPHCKRRQRLESQPGVCLQFFQCPDCGKVMRTPPGYCCLICAFSDEKCEVSIKNSTH